ncbi:protein phosphatase 2C domain-containing protein, partial [Candidatus Saccharibacteria bacterium]|nr:protein phosphatase 2C domain-containing protein [Candidatus Saccharibacteria bacterium]
MGKTRYVSGFLSDAGRTAKNQDAYDMYDAKLTDGRSGPGRMVTVAIASDGINGHQGGDTASELAVSVAKSAFNDLDAPLLERMQLSIQRANREINEKSLKIPKLRGMGCTVIMAVVDDDKLYVAHVGDSRAYLVRGGSAYQLTEDHVRSGGARGSMSQLSRRLGRARRVSVDLGCIPLGKSSRQSAERVSSIQLQRGDTVLLCTDGLTNELSDEYIQQIVSNARTPQAAAQRLISKARAAGGTDDITALLLRWQDRRRRNILLIIAILICALLWFNRVPIIGGIHATLQSWPTIHKYVHPILASLVPEKTWAEEPTVHQEPSVNTATPTIEMTATITLQPTVPISPTKVVVQPIDTPTPPATAIPATPTATGTPIPETATPTPTASFTLIPVNTPTQVTLATPTFTPRPTN